MKLREMERPIRKVQVENINDSDQPSKQPLTTNSSIKLPTLADAQDGSEILFDLARLLAQKRGNAYNYALLIRQTTHAVRATTDQMHPWVLANELDPLDKEVWQDVPTRDSVMGAGEHQSELAYRLGA